MSDQDVFAALKAKLNAALDADWDKTVKGNKQAGTRVRGVMQEIREAAKAVRDEVMAVRKRATEEKAAAKAKS